MGAAPASHSPTTPPAPWEKLTPFRHPEAEATRARGLQTPPPPGPRPPTGSPGPSSGSDRASPRVHQCGAPSPLARAAGAGVTRQLGAPLRPGRAEGRGRGAGFAMLQLNPGKTPARRGGGPLAGTDGDGGNKGGLRPRQSWKNPSGRRGGGGAESAGEGPGSRATLATLAGPPGRGCFCFPFPGTRLAERGRRPQESRKCPAGRGGSAPGPRTRSPYSPMPRARPAAVHSRTLGSEWRAVRAEKASVGTVGPSDS
ncbi:translation initiation factor IF-2-like [Choloepus didactylus]|uniref:translation initiation factor IF-2-like n=1 Tax=Choloepus didactylus TaxID=27675 RepID=UPI0018A025F3|nr:translation initiation factor IF-2-like [Choloepus didactylus]